MFGTKEIRFFGALFFFTLVGMTGAYAARQCCPTTMHLIENSSTCSDNITHYNLTCKSGAMLLDPVNNANDKFYLKSNGSILSFDDDERTDDKFCLGKIQRNESENSSGLVALICFASENGSEQLYLVSVILKLLMLMSTLFLLISLYIYIILPNLRDLQGKCVVAFICCLIASYITLLLLQTFPNSSQEACVMQAAALYFFMSASFFWNNIITFNIWKAVRNISFKTTEKIWTIIYLFWGFGVPFIMVMISFVLEHVPGENHVRPHFAETKCWFRGKKETWSYFYGPVSVLLILNTIMFLQSSVTLWKSYRESTLLRIRSLKFKCMMYLKLFLLMGITWTFEIISYAMNDNSSIKYLWVVTDCLNGAQGIFIFLILVVFRQKVRLGLLEKKIFGVKWPQSWATEEIQESGTTTYTGDLELTNQKIKILEESQK